MKTIQKNSVDGVTDLVLFSGGMVDYRDLLHFKLQ